MMAYSRPYLNERCLFHLIFGIAILHTRAMAKSTMKAGIIKQFGSSEELIDVEEVPMPKMGNNQVLVKVKAAGINPVDTYIREGKYPFKPKLPATLGFEISGIIEDLDYFGSAYQKGDRVFCNLGMNMGGYAEYAVVNNSDCYVLPDDFSFSQGAAVFVSYFTAYRSLIVKGNISKDDTVLIHGASGGVGCAAVQMAKTVGAYVVASVGSAAGEEVAKKSGADHIIYHNKDNYLEDALRHINKPGFDIIHESLANANLQRDMDALAPNGRIVVVGNRGSSLINARSLMTVEGSIRSCNLFKATALENRDASIFILSSFDHHFMTPIVSREYGLREAPQAHRDIIHGKAKGKLVFVM